MVLRHEVPLLSPDRDPAESLLSRQALFRTSQGSSPNPMSQGEQILSIFGELSDLPCYSGRQLLSLWVILSLLYDVAELVHIHL